MLSAGRGLQDLLGLVFATHAGFRCRFDRNSGGGGAVAVRTEREQDPPDCPVMITNYLRFCIF